MASTRRLVLLGGIAALSIFAVPAVASADVYCVDTAPAGCDHVGYTGSAGLQQALTDTAGHAGADAVHIGTGTYATTASAGFVYSNINEAVTITGAGAANTVISITAPGAPPGSPTDFTGLNVFGAGSSISQLKVTLPSPAGDGSNQHYFGIVAEAANSSVNTVTVQGPGAGINATGVQVGGGTVTESTIALPLALSPANIGVRELVSSPNDAFVTHNTITADIAVQSDNQSSGTVRIDRSTLHPSFIGVSALASKVTVGNSLIDLAGFASATGISVGYSNPFAHTSTLSADGVTIYGSGAGQTGVSVFATDANTLPAPGDPDVATGTVANTIIRLAGTSPTALRRQANNADVVNLTTNYSDYDQTTVGDTGNLGGASGALTQQHQTSVDPGFVNPGIDLHLSSSSPLIDAGDPAGPPFGAKDIDGDNREILGKAGCAARRDIGADEFVP